MSICPICHEVFRYCPHMLEEAFGICNALRDELELSRKIADEAIKQTEELTEEVNVWKPALITKQLEIDELRHKLAACESVLSDAELMRDAASVYADELKAKLDIAVDKFHELDNWAKAYPLDVFPEPDWNKAKELLGSNLLSCISASNMRHVINGVKDIVENALAEIEGIGENE